MRKRALSLLPLVLLLAAMLCAPAFALTESEVEAQVAVSSKEAVTGNVLIWFLCAVAFLKVSQKIDSFMASMGVNVGRTGGSLLAEAMIAARGVSMLVKAGGGAVSGLGRSAGGSSGGAAPGSPGTTGGFFKGGLIGMAGRHITNSAVKTATSQTSAVHTIQTQARRDAATTAAAHTASSANINSEVHMGDSSIHPENNIPTGASFQDGGIVTSDGISVPAAPVENIPPAGPIPNGIPPEEGGIVTSDGVSVPAAPIEHIPPAGPIPNGIPPQEGVIVASDGVSVPAAPIEHIPSAGSIPNDIPPQEGVIVTSGSVSAPAAPIGNVPSAGSVPNSIPPHEGAIVTGGAPTPAAHIENTPASGLAPDGLPPQEGVILTGSEMPPSTPSDSAPQVESAPLEGVPVDVSPQGGIVITGGDTAIHTSQTQNTVYNSPAGSAPRENAAGTGGQRVETRTERTSQTVHTAVSSKQAQSSHSKIFSTGQSSMGGMLFSHSLASGGKFANDVIGKVAKGDIRSAGSITGDLAAQALNSYMGYTALGAGARNIPRYSDVEIGGGRITGTETPAGSKEGLAFGMYHAAQYTAPEGPHEKVYSADNTLWYKQYAQDSVERKPYKAPDGTVAYEERIIKKLPSPPKRKDRI